ncbi:MAG TPA: threonine ammonia-lyase [Polyangiales bacterium]
MLCLADIEAAQERLRDAVLVSPCAHSRALSERLHCEVYLKLENLQRTGSFKERGASNKLAQLTGDQRAAGVLCASAGNHAQGVAFHARRLGIHATVVMPLATPLVKISATRELGAEVVLHGGNYDEAFAEARRLHGDRGGTFVHGFDDLDIMAGQGTIGLELLQQVPELEAVIAPIGGGGLISGVAVALKQRAPHIRVYGVQTAAVPSMLAARAAGTSVEVDSRRTIADGIAVKRAGERCLAICERYVDDIITVDEETIAEAVLLLLEREKTLAEGAGAAALAGLLSGKLQNLEQRRVGVIVSGGNIDVNLIARVIDRGLWRSGRLLRLHCTINDVPGALSKLLGIIADQQANVLEVEHERVGEGLELGQTSVTLLLESRGFDHIEALEAALAQAGIITERADHAPAGSGPRRSQRG